MTTPTNWPNPERPGEPMFPERDGWHLVDVNPHYWSSSSRAWLPFPEIEPYRNQKRFEKYKYYGSILTPSQIAEMLAAERERCAKAATEVSDTYYAQREEAESDDEKVYADERMCAAKECAEAIRNLGAAP